MTLIRCSECGREDFDKVVFSEPEGEWTKSVAFCLGSEKNARLNETNQYDSIRQGLNSYSR